MTREKLAHKVHEMVWSVAAADLPFDDSDNFREVLGLDSLDGVELMLMIEIEWDLHLSDEEAEKMYSVNDIVDFLERNGVA